MGYIDKEGCKFRITETGHIDTRYYLNKAHFERGRAATMVLTYARDKFMGVFRCVFRLMKFKSCTKPARG